MTNREQRRRVQELVEAMVKDGIPPGHCPLVLITGRMISPRTSRIACGVSEHLYCSHADLRAIVVEAIDAWIVRREAGECPNSDPA